MGCLFLFTANAIAPLALCPVKELVCPVHQIFRAIRLGRDHTGHPEAYGDTWGSNRQLMRNTKFLNRSSKLLRNYLSPFSRSLGKNADELLASESRNKITGPLKGFFEHRSYQLQATVPLDMPV
jgi:hypothetical protein